ncbi:RNA polymerase sigma factor RpoH [Oleispirillum naphthae]|uniref:RNA polymerase sigma factor RpoH n=1 Tax=Oleispirillum naphthae TaxID=2838853 RepID=UPI00308264F9
MTTISVPAISDEGGLQAYLRAIRVFPILPVEEEYMLSRRFSEHGDIEAAHKLVTSHLRLVAKIAMGYRHYGLPVADLISEGNVGLMRAVKKFDPERGFRLSTYAMWWIKAAINEYILNSWSMVKIGTVAAQKKLFFNLRRAKAALGRYEEGDLAPSEVAQIAKDLGVPEHEVVTMNRRLARPDATLNAPVGEEGGMERIELLVDSRPNQEEEMTSRQENDLGKRLIADAMSSLSEREAEIIRLRRLQSEPMTLEDIGRSYGISRERVRQIENRAFDKLSRAIREAAGRLGHDAPEVALFTP